MRRVVIAAMADMHAGCKYALCNPAAVLYDRDNDQYYSPGLTKTQEYLWELYQADVASVLEFAGGDELIFLHNGDATHGIVFRSELVSSAAADQITIACANLRPWFGYERLTHVRMISGTGVHVMGESSAEILIAQLLAASYPGQDTAVKTHGLMTINGITVDVAHHGPHPGSRDWLRGNVARFYLRDMMTRDQRAGRKPPRLVLRAHFHSPVHEYLEQGGDESDLFILPSWSMLDEHAQKATRSASEVVNGLTAFELVDGELASFARYYHAMDVRQVEVL